MAESIIDIGQDEYGLMSAEAKSAMEKSPIPFAVYYMENGRYKIYLVSDGLCRLFEESRQQHLERITSEDPFCNLPRSESKELLRNIRDFVERNIPFNVIYHTFTRAGRRIMIHSIAHDMYTEDGKRYAIVSFDDESDDKAQFLFQDNDGEETTVLASLCNDYTTIWLVDSEDRTVKLIRVNRKYPEVKEFVSTTASFVDFELCKKATINKFVEAEDRDRVFKMLTIDNLRNNVKDDEVYTITFRRVSIEGETSHLQLCVSKVVINGQENFVIGIRDVKALVKQEVEFQEKLQKTMEKVEAADKAKSSFLFNMSHDIRTPINAIIGFTELAETYEDDLKKRKECIDNVKLASRQLLNILNDVLEMARIESGTMTIETDVEDTVVFHDSWMAMFDAEFKKKKLIIREEFGVNSRYLYMDWTHLSEIFMNIISNAIKYTPEGGIITVKSRELPGRYSEECIIETVFEDTGIGMSQEFVDRAFEEFSRERNTTLSGIQGTGLGLAIVKHIVDLMEGTIVIESAIGEGTRVTLRTPHKIGSKDQISPHFELKNEIKALKGKRILLAEDNDINAEIAMEILRKVGMIVDRAEDGVICIDMLKKAPVGTYDAILMDIQMPNMDGYRATHEIRSMAQKSKASIPILAMTANAFKEDAQRAIASGMNGHIAKPIDLNRLMNMLEAVMR